MKTSIKTILTGVVGVSIASGLWGCSAENPFESEGTGTVHLRTVVNAITTRAEDDNDTQSREQALRDNCVVYISNSKGLIFKEKGLDNVPESMVLKTGHYVAEAWSGDSVTASFDKMFFRAYQPFDVQSGNTSNVVLNCKIQNVVVSINTATIDSNLMKDDYVVTVKNTRGELVFTKENAGNTRGYFMMPNGDENIEISISGTRKDGEPFTKTETIKNVERAHHYILNFAYNPGVSGNDGPMGAVFLQINIKDENLDETSSVTVPTGPTITGVEFNVEKQQVYTSDEAIPESGLTLKLCAFGDGYSKVNVATESWQEMELPNASFNVLGLSDVNKSQCNTAGLSWTVHDYKSKTGVSTMFLAFDKDMIKKLTAKATEHQINITVIDKSGQSTTVPVRIARTENAIIVEDPIVVDPVNTEINPMNLTGSTATITFSLADDIEGTPGVEYRKAGESGWKFIAATQASNAPKKGPQRVLQKRSITLTGLETGTEYEYRACCGEYHSDDIMTFKTEEKFIIPYADMETWNSFTIDGKTDCTLPGTGENEFWGNGNPGSRTAGITLTQGSTDMFHSASKSAKLRSQKAGVKIGPMTIGKFAAGNLFIGQYVRTDGTDGVLKFGRKYNNTHPKSLKVWANYRPGKVEESKSDKINVGDDDQGQIYWAITTAPIDIRTKNSEKLFNKDDEEVIAFGEYNIVGNYGSDGELKELVIPIEYNSRAYQRKPASDPDQDYYLVIVCTASRYGDYFVGGEGSTLYLDDFELVY